MQATLALEDGRVFRGKGYGAKGECSGEVVFNTSITGYQEIFTDPSYAGQIVVLTNPEIGNYGTNPEDNEATRPYIEGLIVREFSKVSSNWRSQQVTDEFMEQFKTRPWSSAGFPSSASTADIATTFAWLCGTVTITFSDCHASGATGKSSAAFCSRLVMDVSNSLVAALTAGLVVSGKCVLGDFASAIFVMSFVLAESFVFGWLIVGAVIWAGGSFTIFKPAYRLPVRSRDYL